MWIYFENTGSSFLSWGFYGRQDSWLLLSPIISSGSCHSPYQLPRNIWYINYHHRSFNWNLDYLIVQSTVINSSVYQDHWINSYRLHHYSVSILLYKTFSISSFKTARLLAKHSSVHSGVKPHQCDVCGKQFRERGALKEHNRIHTGVMPYSCEYCGKNFRFKGILTVSNIFLIFWYFKYSQKGAF